VPSVPDVVPVHLVTQDGQPYGSTRLCCERCGSWVRGAPADPNKVVRWTDDLSLWDALPDGFVRCVGPEAQVLEVMGS
jgi:hypothetical protein